ncbi:MAG: hypothetical protein ACJ786_36610 [Catenulispora sp.]
MYESPVALFVPPELSAVNLPPPARLALPPVAAGVKNPATRSGRALLGVAVVDRSGRVRDRVLMDVLGWADGERLAIDVQPGALVLRPDPEGVVRTDARDQVVLPAGARTLVGIASGQRVVLAALPDVGVMFVQPVEAVADWLADRYADLLGRTDDP